MFLAFRFLLIYFLSGFSSLVYEIVWLRFFTRILGSSSQAVALLLAVFMGGLGLGSYLGGRLVRRVRSPLGIYVGVEIGVAILGMTSFFYVRLLPGLFQGMELPPGIYSGLNTFLIGLFLLIPTVLMGATYPLMVAAAASRGMNRHRWASILYGINTLGAVAGTAMASFVLIGLFGEWNTLLCAVAFNLLIALLAFSLRRIREKAPSPAEPVSSAPVKHSISSSTILIFSFACGFTSLAFEVFWTRKLVFWMGSSIYAFGAMLCIFLSGTAMGSLFAERHLRNPGGLFSVFRRYTVVLIHLLVLSPFLFYLLSLSPASNREILFFFNNLRNLFLYPFLLIFPVTFCFGALFPLCVFFADRPEASPGSSAGKVYAVNTLGAISGAVVSRFILLNHFESVPSILCVVSLFILADLFCFRGLVRPLRLWIPALSALLISLGIFSFHPVKRVVEDRIRKLVPDGRYRILFNREDSTALTTAFERGSGDLQLWINGIGMTHIGATTQFMTHLPLALTPEPRRMLIVCLGMGTTLVSASLHEQLENIDVVELVPSVFACFPIFHPEEVSLMKDPRIHWIPGDGRNHLLNTGKRYDVITIDPSPPIHSSGTVNLYTREFHRICLDRLTEQGTACLWIPDAYLEEMKMLIRTFRSVYPHTWFWLGPQGVGIYCIGRKAPIPESLDELFAFFDRDMIKKDIARYSPFISHPFNFFSNLFLFPGSKMPEILTRNDPPVLEDNYPYTEFPLIRSILAPKRFFRTVPYRDLLEHSPGIRSAFERIQGETSRDREDNAPFPDKEKNPQADL